jgi:uncharacterized protein (TIGR03067 family)
MHPSVLIGLALVVGAPAPKEAPKEPPSAVGEWVATSVVVSGKGQAFTEKEFEYTLTADGKFVVRKGKEGGEGRYTLDRKKDPPEIDIFLEGDKSDSPTMQGIYKVDGDTLTLCVAPGGKNAKRPKSFEAPAGSEAMLLTLERAKKKD